MVEHIDIISADSVERVIDSLATLRLTAQHTLFGEASKLCGEATTPLRSNIRNIGVESIIDNPVYVVLVVAFLLLYLVWLPHIIKGGSVKWSLLMHHHHRVKGESQREIIGKQRFGMLIATWTLGLTLLSLLTARLTAQFNLLPISFDGADWIIGGVVAVAAIILYGWVVLKCVGYLIIDMEFTRKLLSIKRQMLFFGVILLSPLFIASSLANYEQGEWVSQLSVIVTIALLLSFIYRSFLLFGHQNFSILHWFLYLCGVEILPLTFIWAMTTRYLGM